MNQFGKSLLRIIILLYKRSFFCSKEHKSDLFLPKNIKKVLDFNLKTVYYRGKELKETKRIKKYQRRIIYNGNDTGRSRNDGV